MNHSPHPLILDPPHGTYLKRKYVTYSGEDHQGQLPGVAQLALQINMTLERHWTLESGRR